MLLAGTAANAWTDTIQAHANVLAKVYAPPQTTGAPYTTEPAQRFDPVNHGS